VRPAGRYAFLAAVAEATGVAAPASRDLLVP
jgi:hypothetical protein